MTITEKNIFSVPGAKHYIRILAPSQVHLEKFEMKGIILEKVAIVLPTYNERANLINLIPELEDVLEKQKVEPFIIIVDDNSLDGTGNAAIQLAKTYGNITVIQRPGKLGLGSAYRVGFNRALEKGADIIFMMDSDLSHRPEYIPHFLNCMKKSGAGLVIGSRYCKDGGMEGWPFLRKLISFSANFVARVILGIRHVHDTTSGFRAFKANVLKQIDYNTVVSNGYSFLGELLFRSKENKVVIKEIPFIFYERIYGTSKLGKSEIKEFIIYVVRSVFFRISRFLKIPL